MYVDENNMHIIKYLLYWLFYNQSYQCLCLYFTGENQEQIQQALSLALKDGVANPSSVTIYVLGQENSGKTCLIASLLGDKFEEQIATQGADVDVCKIFASKWSRIERSKVPKKLQKLYHGQLHVTAQIKISAEQQQPVLKAKDRQQLLESLPELPEAVKADLEQAKSAVLIDEDGINAIIWDFAGQSVYYGLHSMFLKEDNVAMIVFDASQPLQDPVKGRDSQKDPYTQKSVSPTYTGVESVCYWLQSIYAIRKDGTNLGAKSIFVPTIFFVATHIDLIGDSKAVEKRKKEIIDQLVLLLQDKPFAKHIASVEYGLREALENSCFFISNKVRNLEELDRLKSMLVEAFWYIKNRQHPIVFLNVEKTLLSLNKTIITTAEFHAIAHESGFFAKPGSEESNGALAHFHNKGTILYFPEVESLKDLVVLSPDWLTKLFSYIIIAHPYILECNYGLQYKRLKDYGILEENFIAYMVNKFNAEQEKFGLPIGTSQAIEFAQLFGFIAEVHNNTYFLEEMHQPPVSEKQVFIVPPMLPLQLPDNVKVPDDEAPKARIVYFKFPEGFVPPMVFYQMLSFCINRNVKRGENLYW